MLNPSEGKVAEESLLELDDDLLDRVPIEYFERKPVLGRLDALSGHPVVVPTTIYETAGDDTSGVAGLLLPSGEFIEASPNQTEEEVTHWAEEPDTYVKGPTGSLQSWGFRKADLVWNGTVTGSIDQQSLDGEDEDLVRQPVKRRLWDASLLGEWPTKDEMRKPLRKGIRQDYERLKAA